MFSRITKQSIQAINTLSETFLTEVTVFDGMKSTHHHGGTCVPEILI